jgi:hypothetical protein
MFPTAQCSVFKNTRETCQKLELEEIIVLTQLFLMVLAVS